MHRRNVSSQPALQRFSSCRQSSIVIRELDHHIDVFVLGIHAVEVHPESSYMRPRTPTRLRTHILWGLVVLFVVFLHLRGRSLEHASDAGHRHPVLTALAADSRLVAERRTTAKSQLPTGSRRQIIAFVGVQACPHVRLHVMARCADVTERGPHRINGCIYCNAYLLHCYTQTGFSTAKAQRKYAYEQRRQQLRSTWFPGSKTVLAK
jgi:hypothetical protein